MQKTYQNLSATISGSLRRFGLMVTGVTGLAFSAAQAGELKIVHINDVHSHLLPDSEMSLQLAGDTTQVVSGGMAAVVAKFKQLGSAGSNVYIEEYAREMVKQEEMHSIEIKKMLRDYKD